MITNDIFKRILSYFIGDVTFKINTSVEGWLPKLVLKTVQLQHIEYGNVEIADDITKF